jgi:Holliday junction resolvase
MAASKGVGISDLVEAYKELGSVKLVGRRFGMNGSSVHERLVRNAPDVVNSVNRWTSEDDERLREKYHAHADAGTLSTLAKDFGRTKHFMCRQARRLGMTDQKRRRPYRAVWSQLNEEQAAAEWDLFRASPLGLIAWCKKNGYDDLGFSKAMKRFFSDEWESVIESKQPRQSMYRRGRQLEYKVRDHLRKLGFFAQRSPASKSPVDILAVRRGEVWMVQCKRGGALGVGEWNQLIDTARAAGAIPIMASMETGRGSLAYFHLDQKKDGTKRQQPMTRIYPAAQEDDR